MVVGSLGVRRLYTWNARGLLNRLQWGYAALENFIQERRPDVLCLQEVAIKKNGMTKEQDAKLDALFADFHRYVAYIGERAEVEGQRVQPTGGTAIFIRKGVPHMSNVAYSFRRALEAHIEDSPGQKGALSSHLDKFDDEDCHPTGRLTYARFPWGDLLCVYLPSAVAAPKSPTKEQLAGESRRLERCQKFERKLEAFLKLRGQFCAPRNRHLLFVGDVNDSLNTYYRPRAPSKTNAQQAQLDRYELTDIWRQVHGSKLPMGRIHSWCELRVDKDGNPANGLDRTDSFFASPGFIAAHGPGLTCDILATASSTATVMDKGFLGSNHAPIELVLGQPARARA